jgi:hypothetical protein
MGCSMSGRKEKRNVHNSLGDNRSLAEAKDFYSIPEVPKLCPPPLPGGADSPLGEVVYMREIYCERNVDAK